MSIGDLGPEAQRIAELTKSLHAKSTRLSNLTEQYDRLLMGLEDGNSTMNIGVNLSYGNFSHQVVRKKEDVYKLLLEDILSNIKEVRADIHNISKQFQIGE